MYYSNLWRSVLLLEKSAKPLYFHAHIIECSSDFISRLLRLVEQFSHRSQKQKLPKKAKN
jgi:hypothetical protein